MKLKVYTKDGSNFTEQEFENIPQFEGDKGVFALKETLVAYQANARQGNASTLDYGSVSGTCRKPFKQKRGRVRPQAARLVEENQPQGEAAGVQARAL